MRIAREEIFGPVLSVIPYQDEADAVRIANDSDYGLGGAVWTADPERGMDIARQVRTGTVWRQHDVPVRWPAPRSAGTRPAASAENWAPRVREAYLEYKSIARPAS